MSVSEWTYANWENGTATPSVVLYMRVIQFLGYYPHPAPRSLGHRLLKIRRCLGMTSRQTADLIGVDHRDAPQVGKWSVAPDPDASKGRSVP